MNRILTIVLLLSAAPLHAQERPAPPAARLIDSFGEIQLSDLMARLDNFAIELQNDPGARGVIVSYAAPNKFPGWPQRRARTSLNYLVKMRGLGADRLSAFNGGLRDETAVELWLVPAGAALSVEPFDVARLMSGAKSPLLLDRFVVVERFDRVEVEIYERDPYPDDAYLYGYLAEVLRSDPALRGCVIGYASRRGSLAAARRIASRAKVSMAKAHAVDLGRVVALGGGRREYKTIELWLVPPGAKIPQPTPPARAVRRRRR